MAWIESHTVLLRHRKVLLLANDLALPPVYVVGHLHALWHAVLEQQEDGDLSEWPDTMIAQAASYTDSAAAFVKCLQARGFLDGRIVHDWIEYAGRYLLAKYRTTNLPRLHKIWAVHGKLVQGIGETNQEGWTYLKIKVFERDKYTCKYCGITEGPFHIDHVIPVSKGGGNTLDNLVCACEHCNLSKGANSKPKTKPPKLRLKSDLKPTLETVSSLPTSYNQPNQPNLTRPNLTEPNQTNLTEPNQTQPDATALVPSGIASTTLVEVVQEWNSHNDLIPARSVTGPIRKAVERRIAEHPDMTWWRNLFQRVAASDFLAGRKTDFAASLDWVLGPKNLAKIENGNYDNRVQANGYEALKEAFLNS